MIARTLVAVAAVALITDTASAQFRRTFPYPQVQPTFQPPQYRPVPVFVGSAYPAFSGYPVNPPPSTAVGQVVDTFTGVVTQYGTTADPYTGAVQQSASRYDPFTGTTITNSTFGNPFTGTGVNRQTAGNPITGRYISTTRTLRPRMLDPFRPRLPMFPR